jgi:hypothetical protein
VAWAPSGEAQHTASASPGGADWLSAALDARQSRVLRFWERRLSASLNAAKAACMMSEADRTSSPTINSGRSARQRWARTMYRTGFLHPSNAKSLVLPWALFYVPGRPNHMPLTTVSVALSTIPFLPPVYLAVSIMP